MTILRDFGTKSRNLSISLISALFGISGKTAKHTGLSGPQMAEITTLNAAETHPKGVCFLCWANTRWSRRVPAWWPVLHHRMAAVTQPWLHRACSAGTRVPTHGTTAFTRTQYTTPYTAYTTPYHHTTGPVHPPLDRYTHTTTGPVHQHPVVVVWLGMPAQWWWFG